MTIKRSILSILTIIILIPLIFSLVESFRQPQVQSDLQLYQTNIILQAAELKPDGLDEWGDTRRLVLGQDPYKIAQSQYQTALEGEKKTLARLQKQAQDAIAPQIAKGTAPQNPPLTLPKVADRQEAVRGIDEKIQQAQLKLQKLNLKLGLLDAQRGQTPEAIARWQAIQGSKPTPATIPYQTTAHLLQDLWRQSPPTLTAPTADAQIRATLPGWFRYRALKQLYQVVPDESTRSALAIEEQDAAREALVKLSIISLTPLVMGLGGCAIAIFLVGQWIVQRENSFLATYGTIHWETPWGGETIWQVLVVGFFFIGQILLPIAFGFLHFEPSGLSLRGKAIYVLVSYLSMTVGGLAVLYFSLRPFFPLPPHWFQFKWWSRWPLWGLGGYLVALPLVVVVSLVNQLFWNGQGGSNPLLSLALESQDRFVLGIFFFTASIAAPFFEELMFRGFLIPSLTRYVPIWGAIAISSVIFALAHLNLSEVLPLMTLGAILGMVYARSQNLLASMFLHGLWNSGTLLSLFTLGSGAS